MVDFKCNVEGCKYKENWEKMCPHNMLWLDINAHFVRHHPELHKDMGNHIMQRIDGKWISYNPVNIEKLKQELDRGAPKKVSDGKQP